MYEYGSIFVDSILLGGEFEFNVVLSFFDEV